MPSDEQEITTGLLQRLDGLMVCLFKSTLNSLFFQIIHSSLFFLVCELHSLLALLSCEFPGDMYKNIYSLFHQEKDFCQVQLDKPVELIGFFFFSQEFDLLTGSLPTWITQEQLHWLPKPPDLQFVAYLWHHLRDHCNPYNDLEKVQEPGEPFFPVL